MRSPIPFPDTPRTWLDVRLDGGENGRKEVGAFLMELYAEPLRRTAQEWYRLSAEEALDLVHGFFASRLDRTEYLRQWRASEKRLRQWLWTGLGFYRKECRRADRRMSPVAEVPEQVTPESEGPPVEFERRFAVALVQAAMARAEVACRESGFVEHWEAFAGRATGEPLVEVAKRLGLTENQIQVRTRAAQRRFVAALGDLLVADGVAREEVPRAVRELVGRDLGEI